MQTKNKTRKQPTEAQKQAAQERRDSIKKIAKTVSAMTPAQREAMANRFGGIVTVEGRRLSIFNSCLLIQQREGVSMVGGFNQWRTAGRMVRKGAKALAIWIPTGKAEAPDDDEMSSDTRQRFMLANVFDIDQTEEISNGN